jgi:hypothetical protein
MSDKPYDSTRDTLKHIDRVQELLFIIKKKLGIRGQMHDRSKLFSPEKEVFDEMTPRLKSLEYGSEEYKASLKAMKQALDHHYANNRHHVEFHSNGIEDMNLIDVVEMLCDWKAASERHETGNIMESIRINTERFGLEPQVVLLLENTIRDLEWEERGEPGIRSGRS